MAQRILTGVISAALLLVVSWVRGLVFDIAVALVCLLCCYEIIGAFCKAGLHPPRFPVYGMAAAMLPLFWWVGVQGVYMAGFLAAMGVMLQITLRKHPAWPDAAASLTALISVLVPLTMMLALIRLEPSLFGAWMTLLAFVIALLGDTFAYFVGVSVGKHRMAPELSPKKTWEGSAAGLLGSVVGALLMGLLGQLWLDMPPLWHFLVLGLIGGVFGQLGDLSASLVKRYCGVKDYGTLFPGHGGMMDRVDSVLFVTYVVFGYCLLSGLI